MNRIEGYALAFDLYGTLVVPPPPAEWRTILGELQVSASQAVIDLICGGFPAALGIALTHVPMSNAIDIGLLRSFATPRQFFQYIEAEFPGSGRVPDKTVALVERLTAFAVNNTVLATDAAVVLSGLAERGTHIQIVSDVSEIMGSVVVRLGLHSWFPDPQFSWRTAKLKRDGAAFRELIARAPDHRWMIVGDSWETDILPSTALNLACAFLDPHRRHPASMLLEDARCLLTVDEASGSVSVPVHLQELFKQILPVKLADLERDPTSYLRLRPDGTVQVAPLEQVTGVESLSELLR